jgi:hypothetical protein
MVIKYFLISVDYFFGVGQETKNRIAHHNQSEDRFSSLSNEIAEAVKLQGTSGRVCTLDYAVKCPTCGSQACGCMCGSTCAEGPAALTSDPVNYPIEPGIVPLVFEMKRLGIFEPCWSCEGYLGPTGDLWKLPRVWFYCESTVQIRLLMGGLKDMEVSGKLANRWQVAVTFSDPNNPETTFSLEPVVETAKVSVLPKLQADTVVIARSLEGLIIGQGRKLQRDAAKTLKSSG